MKAEPGIVQSLSELQRDEWNQLGQADYPFTRYQFLLALEQHECLYPFGWQPAYFILRDSQDGRLVAACASYIKSNNYGELVFDHNWAQAYERYGQPYYPKLVSAIPYTPATGPRLLVLRDIEDPEQRLQLKRALVQLIQSFCKSHQLSGWHLLFERESQARQLADQGLLYRYDCQFHWYNQDYSDFDDFLSRLSSRKRKNIRRERASVAAEKLDIRRKYGDEMSEHEWRRVYQLYTGIFDRKYGTPTLSAGFFQDIGRNLKQRVMCVLVYREQQVIAASLFLISDSTLYGRLWGCDEFYNHLHFECCYYQGIDYCIEQGLARFDPGAQGQHKISRGFLPTRTCSAHWFPDPDFHHMIERYLAEEEQYVNEHCEMLNRQSPYRKTS